ncbi:TlpA family protein disulfide reductase [Fibrisoma montanum]|uniref:TlpA family protein disulfide reductase n=1 Tax=Fibrisoma montanum TaxID=2305895 RepID=A0A418LYX6_9BACT|nr:TlpA family protein disulfide reductase [Fibrisoma montanum]
MDVKAVYSLLLSVAVVLPATAQFKFSPEKPQLGQVVSFTYTPQRTPLAGDTTLEGRYVRYNDPGSIKFSKGIPVPLVRQGDSFTGQLPAQRAGTAGMMIAFRNAKAAKRTDLNNGRLYSIPFYDGKDCLVPHALGGQASVFSRTGFMYDLDGRADPNWLVLLYEWELIQYPEHKPQYWSDYALAMIKQRKPGYGPKVKAYIDAYLTSRPEPTADELTRASGLYEQMGDFAKANALRDRMKNLDPKGPLMQKSRAEAVRNEPNWAKKKAAYEAFVKDFPNSTHTPVLTNMITDGYYKAGDLRGLVAFIEPLPNASVDPQWLNSVANQLAEDRRGLTEAEWMIKRALAVLDAQPKPARPSAQWEAEQQARKRQYLATYAFALEQQGKDKEAYDTYLKAINTANPEDSDIKTNERYWLCALRTGNGEAARPNVEAFVQEGRSNNRLKNALRDYYAKKTGNAAEAETYVAKLEADLRADLREELRSTLINEPAPAFTMTDLKGQKVSLASLRGKVVVLDFWATWCVPCIMSFPAMQQAKAYFKNDPKVQFLFVNTREGGPLQRVHDFMAKRPYGDFVVPVDAGQRVANAYKVQGIPTKVIIDPQGRVRYRGIGYSGDAEATANEMTLLVELLKEGK